MVIVGINQAQRIERQFENSKETETKRQQKREDKNIVTDSTATSYIMQTGHPLFGFVYHFFEHNFIVWVSRASLLLFLRCGLFYREFCFHL